MSGLGNTTMATAMTTTTTTTTTETADHDTVTTTGAIARGDAELVLLSNDSMRARRAPLAILWMWGFQSLLAMLAAWPLISFVSQTYGAHPRGDAPLWRGGAHALLDLLDYSAPTRGTLTPLPMLMFAVAAVLGLVPLALLLGQMTYATRSKRPARFVQLMPRALRAFTPMLVLFALTSVVELVVLGIGFAIGGGIASGMHASLGEARASQYGAIVELLFAAVVSVIGVWQDLARAAIFRFNVGAKQAARLAWNTLRRGPVMVYWSWAWRAVAMLALLILGSVVAEKSKSTATGAILPLFALHQGIIVGRIAFRASWLAKALRSVDLAHRVVRKARGSSRSLGGGNPGLDVPASTPTPPTTAVTPKPFPAPPLT